MSSIENLSRAKKAILLLSVSLICLLVLLVLMEAVSYFLLKKNTVSGKKIVSFETFIASRPAPFIDADDFDEINSKVNGHLDCPASRIIYDRDLGFPKLDPETYHCGTVENVVNGIRATEGQPSNATHNIYAFGGSTMWGAFSADRNTIPSQLQNQINKKGLPYKVINQGFTTVVAHQQLNRLKTITIKNGDLVIFYDGGNDIWNSMVYGQPTGTIIGYNEQNRLRIWLNRLKFFMSTKSYTYQLLHNLKTKDQNNPKQNGCKDLPSEIIDKRMLEGFQAYQNAIEQARAYTVARGGIFFHFLQPLLISVKPYSAYTNKLMDNLSPEVSCGLSLSEKGFAYYKSHYPSLLTASINSFDLSDSLPSSQGREYFLDWIHVSSNGNKKIATVIFDKIKDSLSVKD